jgi:hypothetical protein
LVACAPEFTPAEFPAPDAWGGLSGPGGPRTSFVDADLTTHCAYLLGGEQDAEHHNLVAMHDGYLVMPWAPEDGGGGVSFFEFDDPCSPVLVGQARHDEMRESHTLSFAHRDDRDWLAVDSLTRDEAGEVQGGGIGIWDITDPTQPRWAATLELPGFDYPDAYLRVTLSTFWMGDLLYVAGAFNGIFIVDVSEPEAPFLVGTYTFQPGLLVGTVHAIGPIAMVSSAGEGKTALIDLSDPADPQPIPGGDFVVTDPTGAPTLYYFANVAGRYGLFARKENGGGVVVFDISDPSRPRIVGGHLSDDGSGGYVFGHENRLFLGDSNFATVYDFDDPASPVPLQRVELRGDLDTLTPIGNVAVAAVDSGAESGRASAVVPWRTDPDVRGPRVGLFFPEADATFAAVTTPIGLSFDEMIEPRSVFEGSFRVWQETETEGTPIAGEFNAQENLVVFVPDDDLPFDSTIVVEVPAGGITDFVGNPTTETVTFRFTTGP